MMHWCYRGFAAVPAATGGGRYIRTSDAVGIEPTQPGLEPGSPPWVVGVCRHAGIGPRSFQSGDRRLTVDSAPSSRRIGIQTIWLRASAPDTPPTHVPPLCEQRHPSDVIRRCVQQPCTRRFFTQAERRDPPDAKPLRCCRTHATRITRARIRAAGLFDRHTSCRPTVSVFSGVALGRESNP